MSHLTQKALHLDPLVNPIPNPEPTGDLMLSVKPKGITDLFLQPFSQPLQSYLTKKGTYVQVSRVYVTHLAGVGNTLFDCIKMEKLTEEIWCKAS